MAFVIAIGAEGQHRVLCAALLENLNDGAVDTGRSAPALLIVEMPGIAEAGQDQAVTDAGERPLVAREPGQRADRRRDEQKTVAEPPRRDHQSPREADRDGNAREIVVCQARMAAMH